MLDEYFQSKVKEMFYEFKEQYKLTITSKMSKVSFQSSIINFVVYFERSFEIYIVFVFKFQNHIETVDLISIVNYLNINTKDANLLKANQIASAKDIDYVLFGLKNIMHSILDKVYKDKNLLYNAYMYQQLFYENEQRQLLIGQMSLELRRAWKSKNYAVFLEIYQKYMQRDKTLCFNLSEVRKKQLEYSQKMEQ